MDLPVILGTFALCLTKLESFLDGILVRAAESTDDQGTSVWRALGDRYLVTQLDHINDATKI